MAMACQPMSAAALHRAGSNPSSVSIRCRTTVGGTFSSRKRRAVSRSICCSSLKAKSMFDSRFSPRRRNLPGACHLTLQDHDTGVAESAVDVAQAHLGPFHLPGAGVAPHLLNHLTA